LVSDFGIFKSEKEPYQHFACKEISMPIGMVKARLSISFACLPQLFG